MAPIREPDTRTDERDVMFARAARRPGTPAYEDYYARRPERRATDDHLRTLPELLVPGGRHYDEPVCREAAEYFRAIESFVPEPDVVTRWAEALRGTRDATDTVRRELVAMGALSAGTTRLDQRFIYTHKGRFDEDYGAPIDLTHPRAAVFLVEMDADAMWQAPEAPAIRESARQYWRPPRWP